MTPLPSIISELPPEGSSKPSLTSSSTVYDAVVPFVPLSNSGSTTTLIFFPIASFGIIHVLLIFAVVALINVSFLSVSTIYHLITEASCASCFAPNE